MNSILFYDGKNSLWPKPAFYLCGSSSPYFGRRHPTFLDSVVGCRTLWLHDLALKQGSIKMWAHTKFKSNLLSVPLQVVFVVWKNKIHFYTVAVLCDTALFSIVCWFCPTCLFVRGMNAKYTSIFYHAVSNVSPYWQHNFTCIVYRKYW